jgi:hypothetical protein
VKICLWFLVANYFLVIFDVSVHRSDEYSILATYYIFYPFVLVLSIVCEVVFIAKKQWVYTTINAVLGVATVVIADYLGR